MDINQVNGDCHARSRSKAIEPQIGGIAQADCATLLPCRASGTRSVGVKRHYSGTAGRVENCLVGVLLCCASRHAAVSIDRALCLPEEWAANPERLAQAGVPETVAFQTKPALAIAMPERALDAGSHCGDSN